VTQEGRELAGAGGARLERSVSPSRSRAACCWCSTWWCDLGGGRSRRPGTPTSSGCGCETGCDRNGDRPRASRERLRPGRRRAADRRVPLDWPQHHPLGKPLRRPRLHL